MLILSALNRFVNRWRLARSKTITFTVFFDGVDRLNAKWHTPRRRKAGGAVLIVADAARLYARTLETVAPIRVDHYLPVLPRLLKGVADELDLGPGDVLYGHAHVPSFQAKVVMLATAAADRDPSLVDRLAAQEVGEDATALVAMFTALTAGAFVSNEARTGVKAVDAFRKLVASELA